MNANCRNKIRAQNKGREFASLSAHLLKYFIQLTCKLFKRLINNMVKIETTANEFYLFRGAS